MSEPFIGEIKLFGGNFAPTGWALCNGQLLSIAQNSALFSLLGTYFGGNGQTTFGLPDLRGRVPIHQGQGLGLSTYNLGQQAGAEQITLMQPQMPAHTHAVSGSGAAANATTAAGNLPATATAARGQTSPPDIYGASTPVAMSQAMLASSGGNQPHENRQPLLCVTFIIALQGIYPSRS